MWDAGGDGGFICSGLPIHSKYGKSLHSFPSLLRTVIEETKMEGKKARGRPRQMMLDLMMADVYGKLKEEAQQQQEW